MNKIIALTLLSLLTVNVSTAATNYNYQPTQIQPINQNYYQQPP